MDSETIQDILMIQCLIFAYLQLQGPPGKDGLPGHPGQRGETVSGPILLTEISHLWYLIITNSSFVIKSLIARLRTMGKLIPLNILSENKNT